MKFRSLIIAVILSLSFSASALELATAKDNAWVAEQSNGLLAIVKNEAGVSTLVEEINRKRQAQYQKIAKENGLSTKQVASLAAKKAFERSESGHLIQAADGTWVTKP